MRSLIDTLRMFNRKERFYLVGMAVGKPDFQLSSEFRERLGEKIGLPISSNAFVAMDYHLDWVYASLRVCAEGRDKGWFKNPQGPNGERAVRGTQEDVDLLVAFDDNDVTHLVFVEAKGDSAWDPAQLKRKLTRLETFFNELGEARP